MSTTETPNTAAEPSKILKAIAPRNFAPGKVKNLSAIVASLTAVVERPDFNIGDVIKVHAKIVEGTKERIQVFEGVVIQRTGGKKVDASFTVRKISYNVGVERTFPLNSPRIDKIEVVSRSKVRRSKLFYLRPLRGKATRLKTLFESRGPAADKSAPISEA